MDSEGGRERSGGRRAMSVAEFCQRYSTGRTRAYEEIKAGRLRARKCGKRTVISADDAELWLGSLPSVPAHPGVA
jgi:hypothetical protein